MYIQIIIIIFIIIKCNTSWFSNTVLIYGSFLLFDMEDGQKWRHYFGI